MKKLLLLTTLVLTTNSFASDKAIYGSDSRVDIKDAKNPVHKVLAQSVASMIPKYVIMDQDQQRTQFLELTLRETTKICENERFADQMTVATCTGFLVAPNLLVTAGHCIQTQDDCNNNKWVFDYAMTSENKDLSTVPTSNVYSCKRIVDTKLSGIFLVKKDWAVIELDRPVKGRTPLKLSAKAPSKGDQLVVIGSPSGLPLKIATGSVRAKRLAHFITNLDTFAGNSGSPVFNARTHEVEGILVRGDKDYSLSASGWCAVPSKYDENTGRGEDVSYIKDVRNLLNLK